MTGNGSGPTWKWFVGILLSLMILVAGAYGREMVAQIDDNAHDIRRMERLLERIDERLRYIQERIDAVSGVTEGRDG